MSKIVRSLQDVKSILPEVDAGRSHGGIFDGCPGDEPYWIIGIIGNDRIAVISRFINVYDELNIAFDVTLEIFEGVTVTSNGTPITLFNSDRNSDDTIDMLMFHGATVTNEGVGIPRKIRLKGDTKQVFLNTLTIPYIMKKNTIYGFKITNNKVDPQCNLHVNATWNFAKMN